MQCVVKGVQPPPPECFPKYSRNLVRLHLSRPRVDPKWNPSGTQVEPKWTPSGPQVDPTTTTRARARKVYNEVNCQEVFQYIWPKSDFSRILYHQERLGMVLPLREVETCCPVRTGVSILQNRDVLFTVSVRDLKGRAEVRKGRQLPWGLFYRVFFLSAPPPNLT